jgi:hypothetical protein
VIFLLDKNACAKALYIELIPTIESKQISYLRKDLISICLMTQSKVYVVSNLVKAQALCYLISNWLLPSLNDTIPNLKITAIIPNNWSQLGSAGSSVWWRIHVTIILLIQSLNASMCVLVCLCCDLWQHVLDYFCSFPIILILTEPQGKLCNVIQCHFITTVNFA